MHIKKPHHRNGGGNQTNSNRGWIRTTIVPPRLGGASAKFRHPIKNPMPRKARGKKHTLKQFLYFISSPIFFYT